MYNHQQRGGGRLPCDPYWKMTREQQFARRSGDGRGAGRGLKMASGAGADMEDDAERKRHLSPPRDGAARAAGY